VSTRQSPFRGAPVKDQGDYKTETPSEDTHDARIVALIDLGTHRESFQGGEEKEKRQAVVVFELDEEMSGTKGVNHVVAVRYTMSFHEKASLRLLAEAILNDGKRYGEGEIDYELLLGQPCTVQISHVKKATDKGERTYGRVGTIAAVPKKHRERVFKPRRKLTVWMLGDPMTDLPTDWLPRIYGERVEDVIGRCLEMKGRAKPPQDEDEGDEEELPSYGGSERTPF
jgi:hypothetical protein